jgi:hypothetical protein
MEEVITSIRNRLIDCLVAVMHRVSFSFTGSVARGDYKRDHLGRVLSDIEIILIADEAGLVARIRNLLSGYDWDELRVLGAKVQVYITLAEALIEASSSGYVRSMLGPEWIHDGLNLRPRLSVARSINPAAYALQPVAYYYVKYMSEGDERSAVKVGLYLSEFVSNGYIRNNFSIPAYSDIAADEILSLCRETFLSIECEILNTLGSLSIFSRALQNEHVDWRQTFIDMKSTVFLENQGLSPEQSIVRLT